MATTIWNFVASGSRANAKRIEDQDQRLNRHEARLSSVEQDIRNLPAQGDLHQVQLALERMHGDLKEMRAIMGRMESIVSRHEEHLLDGSKR
nr:DUF2730 family protein [Rhodobacter sp. NTK016B]